MLEAFGQNKRGMVAKDPEYIGEESSAEEVSQDQDQESSGQILGNNKRVLSPELLNQR